MEQLEIFAGSLKDANADAVLCVMNTRLPGGTDPKELLKIAGMTPVPDLSDGISVKKVGMQQWILAAGPVCPENGAPLPKALADTYRACLSAAEAAGVETADILAVPTGVYDSRLFQTATTTLQTVRDFLLTHEYPKTVRILCADGREVMTYKQAYNFWFADTKAARMNYEGWD